MKEKSKQDRYRIGAWGQGYFRVDENGDLRVAPSAEATFTVRLRDCVAQLRENGISDPLVIRFPQLLTDRQRRIREAFEAAIEDFSYPRHYQGVFPVKVNHDRVVVETMVRTGREHRFGLEVGSKAELCLALTMQLHPQALLICNGFKDDDYLLLAAFAARHGRRVLVIAENPQEIVDIVEVSREAGQLPLIGFRSRLHTEGTGRWQESSGSKGKFGLSTMEIVEGVEYLRENGAIENLVALHYHMGSQVCDILNVKAAIKEASRLWVAMKEIAPNLDFLDLGGGLGVDYDGSRTATDWSMNYSLEEYARDAVYIVKDVCATAKVEPPIIVTESGRALTAYHAVIILSPLRVVGRHETRDYARFATKAQQIVDLKDALANISAQTAREAFHDATQLMNELVSGFKLGYVSLVDRAVGECLYRDICHAARKVLGPEARKTVDIANLELQLAPKYVCNFSIFMSVPDSWAVQQLFPVCPIEKLNATRYAPATIGDITCDSDGKLERFIGAGEVENFIMLPDDDGAESPLIGMFLVGAYQDVLGDFHNLFGTVNEGVVIINDEDDFSIVAVDEGSSVEHSLDYFGFTPSDMVRNFDRMIDRDLSREAIQDYKGTFLRILHGNTYLNRM
ncbi:MAG: biosynthetic arginine decarboxylase [Planctomycetes bacterium]|nr:biosynthetic arginine decarboxylase [Planctomycetota bacterium]